MTECEEKVLADFPPKKPGRGCCVFVRCPLGRTVSVTSEEHELWSGAGRDAETERTENADSKGHLKASSK